MEAHAAKTGTLVQSKYLSGERFEHEGMRKYPPPDESHFAETGKTVSFSYVRPLIGVGRAV